VSYAQHLLAGTGEMVNLPNPEEVRGTDASPADKAVAEWARVKMFWPWMLGLNGAAGVVCSSPSGSPRSPELAAFSARYGS
jgi:hypothetical protein